MTANKNSRSWIAVTRNGIPNFEVMTPFLWNGVELTTGAAFPKGDTNRMRLRQLYARHLITEAASSPKETVGLTAPAKKRKK